MCQACFTKGIPAALFGGLFAVLFFSAFWSQQGSFLLSADWNNTAKIFAKYAVAFFFLGVAKMFGWQWKQEHEASMKKRR